VRAAVDKAKLKNQKSDFYYKLKDLKKNIKTYQGFFNSKLPTHHRMYLMKKQKMVEEKLKKEKQHIAREVETINKRILFLKK
jgi:hypothetical protein